MDAAATQDLGLSLIKGRVFRILLIVQPLPRQLQSLAHVVSNSILPGSDSAGSVAFPSAPRRRLIGASRDRLKLFASRAAVAIRVERNSVGAVVNQSALEWHALTRRKRLIRALLPFYSPERNT